MSYSRRINRPRGWNLEPVTTYRDKNNLQKGNPELKPEYIDSYELGWQKKWNMSSLSFEGYYRTTNNLITRIHNLQESDIVIHTFENINRDHSMGAELMLNYDVTKWFNLNTSGTLYYYLLEGELYSDDVYKESLNFDARMNNTFRFTPFTRLQLNIGYRGPSATVEGKQKGFLMSDLAVKQDFLKRKLTATFQVRDVFVSMKRERTIEESNYYEHAKMSHTDPIFMATLSLKLNNYKPEKRERDQQQNDSEGGGEYEF